MTKKFNNNNNNNFYCLKRWNKWGTSFSTVEIQTVITQESMRHLWNVKLLWNLFPMFLHMRHMPKVIQWYRNSIKTGHRVTWFRLAQRVKLVRMSFNEVFCQLIRRDGHYRRRVNRALQAYIRVANDDSYIFTIRDT